MWVDEWLVCRLVGWLVDYIALWMVIWFSAIFKRKHIDMKFVEHEVLEAIEMAGKSHTLHVKIAFLHHHTKDTCSGKECVCVNERASVIEVERVFGYVRIALDSLASR